MPTAEARGGACEDHSRHRDADRAPTLLAAGGSGVVPVMAMLRARRLAGSSAPFRLVYSVRAPIFAMYADELAAIASATVVLAGDSASRRQQAAVAPNTPKVAVGCQPFS